MIKFFSKYKVIFYFINVCLIFLYLFPGSIFGCIFLDDCKRQPQNTPDLAIISSNHFYAFLIISIVGFFTYSKKKDLKILKRNKVKYVFLPTYDQIFNFRTIKPIYLSKFAKKLCGKYRPGHFRGVINVVNRFLEIVSPKYIFLGEKDYQQLILIKEHIKKNNIKTKVIPCKTIREVNGLAYSSRNKSLSKSQFNLAGIVFKTIKKMMGKNSLKEIKFQLNKLGIKKIDYIEKIKIKNETRLFIAYYIRQTRLIDNIKLN